MKEKENGKSRRNFLKATLVTMASMGLVKFLQKTSQTQEIKKIKMLTPDGKLVEVEESLISNKLADRQRASNKEVQNWMKTPNT
jgi:hypothetical protein